MTTRRVFVVVVAGSLVMAMTQGWVDGAASEVSGPQIVTPFEEVVAPAPASDPTILDDIYNKQVQLVDATCGLVDEAAAFIDDHPSLAFLAESTDQQEAKCKVAKAAVEDMTTIEIQAVSIKRGPSATVYAEYTGPNRNAGTGDPPEWRPGGPLLAGSEYLGPDYFADGDGDGICNRGGGGDQGAFKDHGKKLAGYGEWCAEVIGDGIGDDDGFCETQNPPGRDKKYDEACVAVTPTLETVEGNPDNLDSATLMEYDTLLSDALGDVERARLASRSIMASYDATIQNVSSGGGCAAPQERAVGSETSLHIVYAAADTAELVMNQANFWADQTFVVFGNGGNVKGAFSWTALIYSIAKGVASQFEVIADSDTATNVVNTLRCLDEFRTSNEKEMDELGDDVAALARMSLQVLELKEKDTYLVSATSGGSLLEGVVFTSVRVSKVAPVAFEEIDWAIEPASGAPGVYLLTISLPTHLRDAGLFMIEAVHSEGDTQVNGHVMFDRNLTGGVGQ